jgi:autophagy-related protein 9
VDTLKKRFFWMGCLHVILMPFILVFMIIHFFLKHAQEWNHSKNYLGPRQWDHLALWHFREFNELPHIFEKRVARSYAHAGLYVKRQAFHNPVVSVLARCLTFISGSFVGVLLVLTLLDDAYLFHITLHDKNLLWYLGVLSAVFAFSRALIYESPIEERMQIEDADEAMTRVAEHTHYFPEHWRGKCNSIEVRDEFLSIFKFKAQLFAEEVLVVLLAPYVLCSAMPAAAERILDFIRNHTVDVEGIGSVCGYSLFSFDRCVREIRILCASNPRTIETNDAVFACSGIRAGTATGDTQLRWMRPKKCYRIRLSKGRWRSPS